MTVGGCIVIVGAGHAGAVTAQALRAAGYAGRLMVIGAERHLPYERPPLSKAVLTAAELPALPTVLTDVTAAELGIEFRLGSRVVAIDRTARSVHLENGTEMAYDRLILATGGRAAGLGADMEPGPCVHTLRTWDDAVALRAALRRSRRIAVVGGGWIGLEAAAAARALSCDVVLLEYASRLCSRSCPEVLSELLRELHGDNGVEIRLNARIVRMRHRAEEVEISLEDGTTISVDRVVMGVGLLANDELASQAGLETDRGIVTDPCGRTGDPHIFACGDVAVFAHAKIGRRMRLESWANAEAHGRACARAVLGLPASYEELPWFWSDQYGTNIQIVGVPPQQADWIRRDGPVAGRTVLFTLDSGVMTCAIAIDSGRDAKICKRLIEAACPVDAARLADPLVDLRRLL